MPATIIVLKVAYGRRDSFLAPLALSDWLHAIPANYVVFDDEISLAHQTLLTTLANKARFMIALSFGGHLLLIDAYGLLTSMALWCVLVETALAQDAVLIGGVWFSYKLIVAFSTAKVLLVPVLTDGFGELAGENELKKGHKTNL